MKYLLKKLTRCIEMDRSTAVFAFTRTKTQKSYCFRVNQKLEFVLMKINFHCVRMKNGLTSMCTYTKLFPTNFSTF